MCKIRGKGRGEQNQRKKYNKEGIGNEKIRGAKEGKGEVTQETGKGGKRGSKNNGGGEGDREGETRIQYLHIFKNYGFRDKALSN